MDVSDRRMQVQLTPEAKIASDSYFIRAIFAVVGFVSALRPPHVNAAVCSYLEHKSDRPSPVAFACPAYAPCASLRKSRGVMPVCFLNR